MSTDTTIADIELGFRADPGAVIKQLYAVYRGGYVRFAKHYTSNQELILDSFQEAVIGFYENLILNKINNKETKVRTYVWAIGKNKLLNALRTTPTEELSIMSDISTSDIDPMAEKYKDLLQRAFSQLGPKCRMIITKYYYHRYSIESIAIAMDYKNENTVKAHKSRCLSKLRDIISKIETEER